jgi:hypothetical protein
MKTDLNGLYRTWLSDCEKALRKKADNTVRRMTRNPGATEWGRIAVKLAETHRKAARVYADALAEMERKP